MAWGLGHSQGSELRMIPADLVHQAAKFQGALKTPARLLKRKASTQAGAPLFRVGAVNTGTSSETAAPALA